jgi:hypothetical protein
MLQKLDANEKYVTTRTGKSHGIGRFDGCGHCGQVGRRQVKQAMIMLLIIVVAVIIIIVSCFEEDLAGVLIYLFWSSCAPWLEQQHSPVPGEQQQQEGILRGSQILYSDTYYWTVQDQV